MTALAPRCVLRFDRLEPCPQNDSAGEVEHGESIPLDYDGPIVPATALDEADNPDAALRDPASTSPIALVQAGDLRHPLERSRLAARDLVAAERRDAERGTGAPQCGTHDEHCDLAFIS
jgi:hypothetical protein